VGFVNEPLPRALHCPGEVEVETRAGESIAVELSQQPAGHLDYEAIRGAGPSFADLPLFLDPEMTNTVRPELARPRFGGGRVALIREGRRLALDRFEVPGAPVSRLDWLVPGWRARCLDPIAPGEWTLRVEGDGGVLFERRIHVEAGRTTVVRW
jgi:hypothetical protein